MNEQITGVVDNGGTAVVDFPFYKGAVGIRTRPGSGLVEVAYRGEVAIVRLPATGRLDGEEVAILTLERSSIDRKMMVATVRPVSE